MKRALLLVVLLGAAGACSSAPRGEERLADLPPPRLVDEDFGHAGRDAGASLAAATSVTAALGGGPIGWAHVANLIPWRELRDLDVPGLRSAFEAGSHLATIEGVGSYSLSVSVLAFAHRARDGVVSVEYSFEFLLVDPAGGTPWVSCVTRTAEGGKGEVETQKLRLADLDLLATQCARELKTELDALGSKTVHVIPCARERRPEAILVIAFEDRLRAALVARGVLPAGESPYEIEIRVEKRGETRETGAEIHAFSVDLLRAGTGVPFARWHRERTN